jgi:hypothetical protein
MTDYSAYTIEAACAVLDHGNVAHKVYKMRCDSSSKCCGETVHVRAHNEGESQGDYQLSQRQIPTQPQPEEQV